MLLPPPLKALLSMADSRKIIKVFLASPGDLQEERRAAKAVVDEFNKLWADDLGYHVELVGWEDTVSRFGRPQALINRDLDRCELFIGMMWKRWGTPPDISGTYTSGFEEEYEISVTGRKAAGKPEIGLLFKSVDPDLLRDPGPELAKVIAFKDKIVREKSILFETFDSLSEFEPKIRGIVTTYVQRLRAAEAEKLLEEAQSVPADGGNLPSVGDSSSAPETALSIEGARFLRNFITKTESEASTIDNVEVARFRLLGSLVVQHGNDEATLGVHDANLLFAHRRSLNLGHRELNGLVWCGLEYYSSSNVPLWHWYVAAGGFERDFLLLTSVIQSPVNRRVGALNAMRLLGQPIPDASEFPRNRFVGIWFSNNSPEDLKVAALGYLSDWGLTSDLDLIKKELDKASYRTTGAAVDSIIRINLRESREKAIHALFELQPASVSNDLLASVFEQAVSLSTERIAPGVDHRSAVVRRITASLLRGRHALSTEKADRLLADSDAGVRYEALQSLIDQGRSVPLSDAKSILIKTASRSLLAYGGHSDHEGEACFAKLREKCFTTMPIQELECMVSGSSIYDRDPYFALAQREFDKRGGQLRASVDSQFESEFNAALDDVSLRFGAEKSLDEFLRKGLTRKGLDVICRMGVPEDLGRVRKALRGGFVAYSDSDVDFLRKLGEWEDIPLIIASVERTDYSLGLLSLQSDAKYDAAARAIYAMGRERFGELVSLTMPRRLLSGLLTTASEKSVKALSDEALITLLRTDDDGVRKTAALKCVRSLPKARVRRLLTDYTSGDTFRYYNVIHWLDLGASLPRSLALRAAGRALATI